MSLRNKRSSLPGLRLSAGGFSSMSMGTYATRRTSNGPNQEAFIEDVIVNKSLLTPLEINIDPNFEITRNQEKEQIKSLNNRFASFINKVVSQEQRNKMLETKWKLLQEQTAASSKVELMLQSYIIKLQRQLESLNNDKHRLDMEKDVIQKSVVDYKTKYEKEIAKKNEVETEFVLLKKDMDAGQLSNVELEHETSLMTDELNILKAVYDMELQEREESLKEISVVVQVDNSRHLNMDQIVSEVKAQYEETAARRREDAESWYKKKFDQVTAEASQYGNELRNTKDEISGLKLKISCLQNEIQAAKSQQINLEGLAAKAEQSGKEAVQDAEARIKDLEVALQKAKQDMALQVKGYQELMNVKMALDIEISTYRKLLEGEEDRLGKSSIVNIQTVPTKTVQVNNHVQRRSGAVFIKTVETYDTTYQ